MSNKKKPVYTRVSSAEPAGSSGEVMALVNALKPINNQTDHNVPKADILAEGGYELPALADDLSALLGTSVGMEQERIGVLGRGLTFDEREQLIDDVVDALDFRDIDEVSREWLGNELSSQHKVLGTGIMAQTNVSKWQRSFEKLAGAQGLNTMLAITGGDVNKATAGLMGAMARLKQRYGSAGIRADWALKYLLECLETLGQEGDEDTWVSAGDASADLLAVALDIMPLVEKLKVVYEPFADRKEFEYAHVDIESDDCDIIPLRTFGPKDLSRLQMTEHLYPEEYSTLRLGAKTALQRVPVEKRLIEKKGCNVKMLIDGSGSMFSTYKDKELGLTYTLWQYAIASAIALLDRGVLHGSNKVEIAIFDHGVHSLGHGTPKQTIRKLLEGKNCSGGGTSFHNALAWADALVDPELNDEIIMITDGGDSAPESIKPQNNKLTTYFCGTYKNEDLRKISDVYHEVTK